MFKPESSALRLVYAALPDPWVAETMSNLTTYAELDKRQPYIATSIAVCLAGVFDQIDEFNGVDADEMEWTFGLPRADALARAFSTRKPCLPPHFATALPQDPQLSSHVCEMLYNHQIHAR